MACPMAFQAVQRRYDLSLGKILEVAARNRSLSWVLTNVIRRRGLEVEITGEMMMEIGYDREACKAVAQLLKENDGEIKITEAAMQNSVLTYNIEVVMVLLDQMAAEFKITEKMLTQAAQRHRHYRYSNEVFALLLRRGDRAVKITKSLVENIAGSFDAEIMTLLLGERGAEVEITEEVMEKAAGNREHGKEMMMLLLGRCDIAVKITENLIARVSSGDVMELLLDRYGTEIEITENLIARISSGNIMRLLLDRYGTAIEITENLIARISSDDVMMFLLDRYGTAVEITEKMVKTIVRNCGWEAVMRLLKLKGAKVGITEGALNAAAARGRGEWGHLLAHKHTRGKITEEKSEIAVANRTNEQERARCIESEVTEAILEVIEESMIGMEESMRKSMMMRKIVKKFNMTVESEYVMYVGVSRKGLWEAFEAEINWTHWKDMWRCFLAQEARNLGIIGIKALFFAAKPGRSRRFGQLSL